MKSKKMTKQSISWASYPNYPKKNILVPTSSKETNIILNSFMSVDLLAMNMNHSSFISYMNTVNREALSALFSSSI